MRRRNFLAAVASALPSFAFWKVDRSTSTAVPSSAPRKLFDPVTKSWQASSQNYSQKDIYWLDEEAGFVGDGITINTQAMLDAALAAVPNGRTLGIPTGRFMFQEPLSINKRINVLGHGPESCFFVQFPYDAATARRAAWPALRLGHPYPRVEEKRMEGSRIGNFSVGGVGEPLQGCGVGLYHINHGFIEPLSCGVSGTLSAIDAAGWNGTQAKIVCDMQQGFMEEDEWIYYSARVTAVGSPYRVEQYPGAGSYYSVADITLTKAFPTKGLVRKRWNISGGAGATPALRRIFSNTGRTVTVILGDAGAGWPSGKPDVSTSVFVIRDGLTGSGGVPLFRGVNIAARTAPYPGRPAGTAVDPLNANDIWLMVRGGSGSGIGALFEASSLGDSRISGIVEGMNTTCIKIVTGSGFSIGPMHCESGGKRTNTGFDYDVVIDGSSGNFELGPSFVSTGGTIINDSDRFELNAGLYQKLKLSGAINPPTHYRISPSAYYY